MSNTQGVVSCDLHYRNFLSSNLLVLPFKELQPIGKVNLARYWITVTESISGATMLHFVFFVVAMRLSPLCGPA